ncbi:MAG: hypothetical protein JRJ09_02335 [Deltaproteobacteria bacterium]|nr:hypothetical protein [Deltaproteobacteria bacterium]MBW2110325.1 hypothetical protein [Deltaproteobacteria bacterium]MBW2352040.1 hypothetical protein [Deltaproteobacteria bacterium]HDZ91558.1 hypothetical protein [Deltaproteobacteria bacterium]
MVNIHIKELLPHRDGMLLVDGLMKVNREEAVSRSTVREDWPLAEGEGVNPLILIELVAQTAGICIGWEELKKKGKNTGGMGWIAGVKVAVFHGKGIPLGSRITTHVRRTFDFEDCHEISGTVKVNEDIVGEVTVQIVKSVPE